jgi:hypothetical protein
VISDPLFVSGANQLTERDVFVTALNVIDRGWLGTDANVVAVRLADGELVAEAVIADTRRM